jgi:acyl carrier protein
MNLEELIAAVLDVEPDAVAPTTVRDDVEAWDSLAQLSLVSALEETYGLEFSSAEMKELVSVPTIRLVLAGKGVEA